MQSLSHRYPIEGTFELTGRCNMACRMCFVRVSQKSIEQSGKRERTAEEWIDMARQAADAGTLNLLLTGGEVTLRPDFPQIYEAIARMGFIITLYTNATMITDPVMEVLTKYPPHVIGVTLYGASGHTYESVCGHPEGFDQAMEGIRKLMTLPSLLDLRTTVIRDNMQDYGQMKAITEQLLGKDAKLHVTARVYPPVRGGEGDPVFCRLSPKAQVDFFNGWMTDVMDAIDAGKVNFDEFFDREKLSKLQQDMRRHSLAPEGRYLFYNCRAGMDSYFISWSGEMYACGSLPTGSTEPFENGFAQAWDHLREQYPVSHENEKCKNCSYRNYCDSCPAYRLLETGSWDGAPTYACDTAKYMKEKFDRILQYLG